MVAEVSSPEEFRALLAGKPIVVVKFYAPSSDSLAGFFDTIAQNLDEPDVVAFVKINTENQSLKEVVSEHGITTLPTFVVFKSGKASYKATGADDEKLREVSDHLAMDINTSAATKSRLWMGAGLPRGYTDLTDEVDTRGLELLNADDTEFSVKSLFRKDQPSTANSGKAPDSKDWVESDTDEQLLLYTPFLSSVKLHTLQITSLPTEDEDEDENEDDEAPTRPRTIKLFINRPHNLGFDEAEDIPATQEIEIAEGDWNANGTANIGLRFVRFQNVTSLVLFVVDNDGDSEKVRIDRIRFIGESGEKRGMGELKKIGDEPGE